MVRDVAPGGWISHRVHPHATVRTGTAHGWTARVASCSERKDGDGMTDFDRAVYLRDLSARSRIARFGLRGQEQWEQTALPMTVAPRPDANDRPEVCGHAGTGRATQKRLFGGWVTVCTRCWQEV